MDWRYTYKARLLFPWQPNFTGIVRIEFKISTNLGGSIKIYSSSGTVFQLHCNHPSNKDKYFTRRAKLNFSKAIFAPRFETVRLLTPMGHCYKVRGEIYIFFSGLVSISYIQGLYSVRTVLQLRRFSDFWQVQFTQ